jgi:uncharacterized protein (DUF1786 family)
MGLLLMDIGRGTQDILLCRPGEAWENSIQLILPSPTVLLADRVREASAGGEDLFFTGETMGGGPLTKQVRQHLEAGGSAWATPRAAATFDDDLDEVASMGIVVVGEEEKKRLSSRRGVRTIRTGDVDVGALEESLMRWGVSFRVGAAAVAVQDHGRAPRGMSDRRFRFARFREMLSASGDLAGLAYDGEELPAHLTRMQGVKRTLQGRGPLLLMDTGFAALLGILSDPRVREGKKNVLLNVGNGHTLAGFVDGRTLLGLFEHHTRRLDERSLAGWLDGLVDGSVRNEDVYRSGGHGAFVREDARFPGWGGVDVFAATGPRRTLAASLERPPYLAAPYGQMMLTGAFGLFSAFEERWGSYEE